MEYEEIEKLKVEDAIYQSLNVPPFFVEYRVIGKIKRPNRFPEFIILDIQTGNETESLPLEYLSKFTLTKEDALHKSSIELKIKLEKIKNEEKETSSLIEKLNKILLTNKPSDGCQ